MPAAWYTASVFHLTHSKIESKNPINKCIEVMAVAQQTPAKWKVATCYLTHPGGVILICFKKLGHHWFRSRLVTNLTPSHYLNQFNLIFNWTVSYKLQWNLNQNTTIFIQQNKTENDVCKKSFILSRPPCVKSQTRVSPNLKLTSGQKIDIMVKEVCMKQTKIVSGWLI